MDSVEAYKIVCESDDPYRAYALVNDLERAGLNIPDQQGARDNIQQTILRSARRSIMKPLIRFCAGDRAQQTIPLPKQWLCLLHDQGVPVHFRKSRFAFFKEQCRGWFRACMTIKNCLINGLSCEKSMAHPQIFKIEKKDAIFFVFESIWILFLSFLKWICGGWSVPFLASELISLAYFKRIKNTPKKCGFSNSSFAIRPLWTYAAADQGANVFLYFYSSNVNVFYAGQSEKSPPPPGYISMSWPEYHVIDDDQKRFFTDQCGVDEAKIHVTGLIDANDNGEEIPNVEGLTIALFDIPVYNRDYIADLGLIAPFYTPEIIGQFVDDVIEVAKSQGYKILWKVKRDMTANTNASSYSSVVEKYENDLHVIMVSPSVNARRIIERTDFSISIPYTSTAIIGKEMDKKAVYYDPTNSLSYFDGLSHDLPVIQGRESLEQLFKSA